MFDFLDFYTKVDCKNDKMGILGISDCKDPLQIYFEIF
jgi:hypothetical protein